MRYRMPVLAAGALAAALAFGPASQTRADPLPELNDFFVADSNPFAVTLFADAPGELEGVQATILFGAQPLTGIPVAGAVLTTGPNLIMAPNMGPGWFTAVGAFKTKGTGSNLDETPDEF